MVSEKSGPTGQAVTIMVAGGASANAEEIEAAEEIGRLLAEAGAAGVTGGGGGIMEAASRGARTAGGVALAILPGGDPSESPPNRHVSIAVFTGMQDARNAILVRTADAVIALGGGWGTLSEVALASKIGRPVVLLHSWDLTAPKQFIDPLPMVAQTAREAVHLALSTQPET